MRFFLGLGEVCFEGEDFGGDGGYDGFIYIGVRVLA